MNKLSSLKKIDPDLEPFIHKLGQFYESLGVTHISGRILGLLLTLDQPFSPEDLARLLKISRSSVSTNLKILNLYGFLEEVRVPGVRRKYFRFSKNAWENSVRIKLKTYDPFFSILQEGTSTMKKKHRSPVMIDQLIRYLQVEKKFYEKMIKDWKILFKTK